MTVPVVMYTTKDFFLLNLFNDKIGILKAAGLIDYWEAQVVDRKLLKFKEISYPQALGWRQLVGCFQVLLFGCVISFVALVCEIIIVGINQYWFKN